MKPIINAVLAVVLWVVVPGVVLAQGSTYYLPIPGMATDQVIQDQQQQQTRDQPQYLSPRNRMFLSSTPQPPQYKYYDAVTINGYMMGSPTTNYRVRPIVRQPMYGQPGRYNQ